MTSPDSAQLANLARTGKLKAEAPDARDEQKMQLLFRETFAYNHTHKEVYDYAHKYCIGSTTGE